MNIEDAKSIAVTFLQEVNNNLSNDSYYLKLFEGEDWDTDWFFCYGYEQKSLEEEPTDPAPVGGAAGIKISKTNNKIEHVSFFELHHKEFIQKRDKELKMLILEYSRGINIKNKLRKDFKFAPTEIINILNQLKFMNLDDEDQIQESINSIKERLEEK